MRVGGFLMWEILSLIYAKGLGAVLEVEFALHQENMEFAGFYSIKLIQFSDLCVLGGFGRWATGGVSKATDCACQLGKCITEDLLIVGVRVILRKVGDIGEVISRVVSREVRIIGGIISGEVEVVVGVVIVWRSVEGPFSRVITGLSIVGFIFQLNDVCSQGWRQFWVKGDGG